MPEGAEKFSMRARNSLSVQVIEPLTRYKIDYDHDGLMLDLTWTAAGPCHELKTGDPGQLATAKFHMEQPGRMTGTARRHGEEWRIDCHSMRDTSFGARDYELLSFGGYFWGIGDGGSFHALCMNEGTGWTREAKCIGGYIMRDGEMASMVSGRRSVLEYGRFGPAKVPFRRHRHAWPHDDGHRHNRSRPDLHRLYRSLRGLVARRMGLERRDLLG